MELPIAQPPWSKLGKRIEKTCRKALCEFSMLDGVESLGVALSGGKDSLTLLFMLHAMSGRGFLPFKLHALHVSGDFSCGAAIGEDFLAKICKSLNVSFTVKKSTKQLEEIDCYSCSRERRKLLFEAAKEVGVNTIAFGHHRDDAVQTLLLNLLHKGEFEAMLPKIKMHRFGITIVRPLIYLPEKEIKSFAEHYNFSRMVCNCPKGAASYRHKVEDLLKEMDQNFPNTRNNLLKASFLYSTKKAATI